MVHHIIPYYIVLQIISDHIRLIRVDYIVIIHGFIGYCSLGGTKVAG